MRIKNFVLKLLVIFALPFIVAGGALAQETEMNHGQMPEMMSPEMPLVPDMGEMGPQDLGAGLHEAMPHTDAHSGEHAPAAGLPQMDPTWFPSQIFWLALTFVCLYFIFAKKVLPDISTTLENRRNQIQGDLDSAQDLKNSADEARRAYEHILNDAREKSADLFTKAEEHIKKKTTKALDGFTLRSEKEIRETEESLQQAKNEALSDMQAVAAEIASQAAKKIIGISTDIEQAKTFVKNIDRKAA